MLHAIIHKGKLVGLFSDYQKCKVMFEGLISNYFVDRKNIEIKSYYENSITSGEYKEDSDNDSVSSVVLEEFTDNNTTDSEKQIVKKETTVTKQPRELNEEEIKNKAELQNSIYELKRKKEKLEESKRVYDVDVDLYKKFKKIKDTNSNFEIPEMFIDKYELMENLEKDNKLCWDNFVELYTPKKVSTNYDKLFN